MKRILCTGILLALTGCAVEHKYQIERVKDVNGNDAFLRIDLTTGDECAVGHGFAVVRLNSPDPAKQVPSDSYLVPFCDPNVKLGQTPKP
jgi:hypothetical protein